METNKKDEQVSTTPTAGVTGLAAAENKPATPVVTAEVKGPAAIAETPTADVEKSDEVVEEKEENTGPAFVEPAEEEVDTYGIYTSSGVLVKTFKLGPHGDNFKELAVAYAERKSTKLAPLTAKPYVSPVELEADKNVVKVVSTIGEPVRTFSLAVHGKDYQAIAKQFVGKYGARKGYRIK